MSALPRSSVAHRVAPACGVRALIGAVVVATGLFGLLTIGCGGKPAAADASTHGATYLAWDSCVVPYSEDAKLSDLPPFPYRDPGPDAVNVTGAGVRRPGPVPFDAEMTVADAMMIAGAPKDARVVLWRCEKGDVASLRPHPDDKLRAHDWLVAPDPAVVHAQRNADLQ